MISKKTFCHALEMIREQGELNNQVSEALQLVGDGFYLFGSKDKYLSALLEVLQEAMDDRYGYIEWWLYEATPDYKVWSEDEGREWCLKEPEALYDYLAEECQD